MQGKEEDNDTGNDIPKEDNFEMGGNLL